jgi:hypothetical protein
MEEIMFRRSSWALAIVFIVLFVTRADATVSIVVGNCGTDSSYTTCPSPDAPPYDPAYYRVTYNASPGTTFESISFPAGPKVIVAGATPGGWTCPRGDFSLQAPDQQKQGPLVVCTGPATASMTIRYQVQEPAKAFAADAYGDYVSGNGSSGSPFIVDALQEISGEDDVPTTIDSGPALETWGVIGLVLLMLGAMSWYLWPRIAGARPA